MFENLDGVREAWSFNQAVTVITDEDDYLIIPLQLVNSENLQLFQSLTFVYKILVLPFKIQKELEIPNLETLGKSISSTFPIMTQLFRNNSYSKLTNFSFSIGPKETSDLTEAEFLRQIGDILENRLGKVISKKELQHQFYSISMVPGPYVLLKSTFHSLKESKNIAELSVELTDIAKYPGGLLITKLQDKIEETTDKRLKELVSIDDKTIINLWRSMNKVQKEEIVYLE